MNNNDNHNNSPTTNNDNVVKFPNNSNYEKPVIDVTEEERRNDLIETLDKLRNMVAEGKMDDVVIVARNTENGFFFTEMAIRKETYNSPEIGTIGAILNSLSIECNDVLIYSPYTDVDGNIYFPMNENG